jgi:tRNA-2-methylthio-N6-dimethylallyladenosine synthase
MNEHDSERMKGMLDSLGYVEAPERDQADLILFNTCSIRESADNRFIAHLGEAKRLKSEDPARVVGVGGCWAQSVKDEVFRRFPFVDVAFGPGQIHRLAEFLTSDSLSAQGYFEFEDVSGHLPMKRARDFQAWLQISQGCNCVCSYCIVPSVRGREVSRDPEELLAEVERLSGDAVSEITLLGQNVNSYGRDLPKERRISFAGLLGQVDAVPGIDRIRYTSPHPKDMREDVIRAHAELPSLCEHIHLPLQSGATSVLKRMRRTYGRERYMDRVALIREHDIKADMLVSIALLSSIYIGEYFAAGEVALIMAIGKSSGTSRPTPSRPKPIPRASPARHGSSSGCSIKRKKATIKKRRNITNSPASERHRIHPRRPSPLLAWRR